MLNRNAMLSRDARPSRTVMLNGRRARRGMVLLLVLLICGVLATIGAASYLQSGGTGRAMARVLNVRCAIEAADAALAETAAAMRASMDTGARSPACPDDWNDILFRAMQGTPPGQTRADPAGRTFTLYPITARARIPTEQIPVVIGDVTAKVLSCYMPPQTGVMPVNPPQGVVELAVTVRGPGKIMEIVRTVRQRRVFHATVNQALVPGAQIQPGAVLLFLTIDPIGTSVE